MSRNTKHVCRYRIKGHRSRTDLWRSATKSNGMRYFENHIRRSCLHPLLPLAARQSHIQLAATSCRYDNQTMDRRANKPCIPRTCFLGCRQTRTTHNERFHQAQRRSRSCQIPCGYNLESRFHSSRNYKWLASEWRHSGWTSYGTSIGGSCSIQAHLRWLVSYADKKLYP